MRSYIKRITKFTPLFLIYAVSGAFFTIFGASLYWALFPLGAIPSILITELCVHSIRYNIFKKVIFTSSKGYFVTSRRYLFAVLPVTLSAFISAPLFSYYFGRTGSTISIVIISFIVGFLFGKKVFKQ